MKYKIGDIVVAIEDDEPYFSRGAMGIVVRINEDDSDYAVKFFAGKYDLDCEGTWYCIDKELEYATKLGKLLSGINDETEA